MRHKKLPLIFWLILLFLCLSLNLSVSASPSPSTVASNALGLESGSRTKAFYAAGRFWVWYLNTADKIVYRTSIDGSSWTSETIVADLNSGQGGDNFEIKYDGTYIYLIYQVGGVGTSLRFRRGVPQADGTITWSTNVQTVLMQSDVWYYRTGNLLQGNLYSLSSTYSATANYTTEVVTGTTTAGYYYYINPFHNHTSSNGTSLPSDILLMGWRTANRVSMAPFTRVFLKFYVKNRANYSHAGNLYFRLWISDNANMSGATAISSWDYLIFSFSATQGEELVSSKSVSLSGEVEDKYLYVEVCWKITTAASNSIAGLYIRAETSDSSVRISGQSYGKPAIAIDNGGYPWITYTLYDGANYYPVVSKSSLNNGTWQAAPGYPLKLTTSSANWFTKIVSTSDGELAALYGYTGATLKLKVYSGGWSSEKTTTSPLYDRLMYTAVAHGTLIHIALVNNTGYLQHAIFNVSSSSFLPEKTIQTANVASTPVLTVDSSTGNLYCFWAGSPQPNHIYYKKYVASSDSWDANPTDWNSDVSPSNDAITGFSAVHDNKVGLAWLNGTASPYQVRFDYFNISPIVCQVKLRAMKWDNTTVLRNAIVYINNGTEYYQQVNAAGWANFTTTTTSVTVKVKYQNCWVNGSFTLNVNGQNKTLYIKCKVWTFTVQAQAANGQTLTASPITASLTYPNGTTVEESDSDGTVALEVYNGTFYRRIKFQGVWVSGNATLKLTDPDNPGNQSQTITCTVYSLTAYVTDVNSREKSGAILTLMRSDNFDYSAIDLSPRIAAYYNSTHAKYTWLQLANQTSSYTVTASLGGQSASNSTSLTSDREIIIILPAGTTSPSGGGGAPVATPGPTPEASPMPKPTEYPKYKPPPQVSLPAEASYGAIVIMGIVAVTLIAREIEERRKPEKRWRGITREKTKKKWKKRTFWD